MAISPAVRVGIIIFLALVALALVAWFLTGYNIRASGYTITAIFDDALGLTTGSEVRMAGVTIGYVEDITLDQDQRAVVKMLINRRYMIPNGSEFVLRVGMLIGEKYLDIIPNRKGKGFIVAKAIVKGHVPVRIEDILPDAKKLVANLKDVSVSFKEFFADQEFQTRIKNSLANVEMATADLERMMAAIRGTVVEQQDEIQAIVSNAAATSKSLRSITSELECFVKEGGVKENISDTLASAKRTTENLERTTASLEKLVAAPEFQEDIRQTAAEAHETVKQAHEVIDRVSKIFGIGGHGPRISIPTRETGLDGLYNPEDNRFRATVTTTIPLRNDSFLDLGIYDLGAGNRLILQPGQAIGPKTDFRYGIYGSRLGLGLDHTFSSRTYGTFNLYDSYRPRLDFQTGYKVTDDWGVLLGVDKLFDDNQFTLGVRLTK